VIRALTDGLKFSELSEEHQRQMIRELQEKRSTLQIKKVKERKIKLPKIDFATAEHKIAWLMLEKVYQKRFL